jgi:hypothetical protein
MTKQTLIDAINLPMNALRYSLASYLRFACPWVDASAQSIGERIGRVAEGHRQHVARIGELLVERHGHVKSETFPSAFTGLNDLSVEYLLPLVIEDEKQIIRVIEATAVILDSDAEASDLVAEVLDVEKRHLQALQMEGPIMIPRMGLARTWQRGDGPYVGDRHSIGQLGSDGLSGFCKEARDLLPLHRAMAADTIGREVLAQNVQLYA